MERRYLSDHHRNECRLRQYSCQYCGYTDTYDGIAGTGLVRNEDSKVAEGLNHNRICGHYFQWSAQTNVPKGQLNARI